MKNIIEQLKVMRKESQISQAKAAAKIGYSDRTICAWENFEKVPNSMAINDYANLFGFEICLREIKND